jgi:hypothetical protein
LIDFLRGLVEFDPAKRWSPFQVILLFPSFEQFLSKITYKFVLLDNGFTTHLCAGIKTPFCNWGTFHVPIQASSRDPSHGKYELIKLAFQALNRDHTARL